MKWITRIEIENYKAFTKKEEIKIPFGNQLVIYGENGSGKSSLYNAFKDFLNSSINSELQFELNHFSKIAGNSNGYIKVEITNTQQANGTTPPPQYIFSSDVNLTDNKTPEILLANKIKGFLDYKQLLELHALKTPKGIPPNFFNLFFLNLLSEHKVPEPTGGVGEVELGEYYKTQRDILKESVPKYRLTNKAEIEERLGEIATRLEEINIVPSSEDETQAILKETNELEEEAIIAKKIIQFIDAKNNIEYIHSKFISLFRDCVGIANTYLQKYFKTRIEVGYRAPKNIYDEKKSKFNEWINLEIKYNGEIIDDYHLFLNEARLSAIGICIYLSALKIYPSDRNDLRLIYLDDIFVGLDTNNRIPLLELLNEVFIKERYQIILSTYDRNWFEITKVWMGNEKVKAKFIELYVNESDNPAEPDVPVKIDPSMDYYELAVKHFECKDYPAAANYLRKACESELRRILPQHLTTKANVETGEVKRIDKLQELVDNFKQFLLSNNLNSAPFTHIETYKKIIFNPLSHDDLESPHYRKEILDGIQLIEDLKKINTKRILSVKDFAYKPLELGCKDFQTERMVNFEIFLLEDMSTIAENEQPIKIAKTKIKVRCNGAQEDYESFYSAMDSIWAKMEYEGATNYEEFIKYIQVTNRKKLIEFISMD